MAVTVEGLIGRAIMASTDDERADAEDMAVILAAVCRRIFCPVSGNVLDIRRSVGLFGSDGSVGVITGVEFDARMPRIADECAAAGVRVFDTRHFTAAGTRRKNAPARNA